MNEFRTEKLPRKPAATNSRICSAVIKFCVSTSFVVCFVTLISSVGCATPLVVQQTTIPVGPTDQGTDGDKALSPFGRATERIKRVFQRSPRAVDEQPAKQTADQTDQPFPNERAAESRPPGLPVLARGADAWSGTIPNQPVQAGHQAGQAEVSPGWDEYGNWVQGASQQHAGSQSAGPQYAAPQYAAPQYAAPQYAGPQPAGTQYAANPQSSEWQTQTPPQTHQPGTAQPPNGYAAQVGYQQPMGKTYSNPPPSMSPHIPAEYQPRHQQMPGNQRYAPSPYLQTPQPPVQMQRQMQTGSGAAITGPSLMGPQADSQSMAPPNFARQPNGSYPPANLGHRGQMESYPGTGNLTPRESAEFVVSPEDFRRQHLGPPPEDSQNQQYSTDAPGYHEHEANQGLQMVNNQYAEVFPTEFVGSPPGSFPVQNSASTGHYADGINMNGTELRTPSETATELALKLKAKNEALLSEIQTLNQRVNQLDEINATQLSTINDAKALMVKTGQLNDAYREQIAEMKVKIQSLEEDKVVIQRNADKALKEIETTLDAVLIQTLTKKHRNN